MSTSDLLEPNFTVINKTKPKVYDENKLRRVWVTMRDVNGVDVFPRRSVILHIGENIIEVRWKDVRDCLVASGAAYENQHGGSPQLEVPLRQGPTRVFATDWVTMSWRIWGMP